MSLQNNDYMAGDVFDRLIVWCLTPTLAVFQLYRGANTFLRMMSLL
jgi:hypothetical protein